MYLATKTEIVFVAIYFLVYLKYIHCKRSIILAGTFDTLYPSNIHVLMELAISVVTGLLLLSMVLLPIVTPALISLQEKLNERSKIRFTKSSLNEGVSD
ncbi:hypothetical protein [Clostridium lacusfryxellense]|uniref:hypothetical protein n=1 Tax=Clostridium lacusfryxellense TaxID=205328 RepID=UPI001C0BA9B0|nr:hypothetical protein [Clostridium lacusfryxellense]MBU3114363.1 hypothetical protein [Clostridium lacusfryxellense]